MPRATDMLVILTYAMIAIVAALAFDRLGLMESGLSWTTGAIVFLIAGQVHAGVARAEEKQRWETAIHELQAGQLSLAEELEAAQERLDALDGGRAPAAKPVSDAPLPEAGPAPAAEAGTPGAGPENPASRAEPPGEMPPLELTPSQSGDQAVIAELIARLEARGGQPRIGLGSSEETADMIRAALAEDRVDLYLQPVVGLPQRRTYFYEGYSRIRDPRGAVVGPERFLEAAERHGLIGELDNLMLYRSIQIIRRLGRQDRRVGVFCNISSATLADESLFPPFLEFLRRNSDLAGSLVFEMSQDAFRARSSVAARHMARLADHGFRFSVDRIDGLDLDLGELQRASVRFVKIGAERLIEAAYGQGSIAGRAPGQVAPEDIAGLFARFGVDIVAEKIETESQVVEVLDLDVAYGQGHLFGAPRPVRDDVLADDMGGERRSG